MQVTFYGLKVATPNTPFLTGRFCPGALSIDYTLFDQFEQDSTPSMRPPSRVVAVQVTPQFSSVIQATDAGELIVISGDCMFKIPGPNDPIPHPVLIVPRNLTYIGPIKGSVRRRASMAQSTAYSNGSYLGNLASRLSQMSTEYKNMADLYTSTLNEKRQLVDELKYERALYDALNGGK